jgi:hypothetical protein
MHVLEELKINDLSFYLKKVKKKSNINLKQAEKKKYVL